jgi:hypothetical protein
MIWIDLHYDYSIEFHFVYYHVKYLIASLTEIIPLIVTQN